MIRRGRIVRAAEARGVAPITAAVGEAAPLRRGRVVSPVVYDAQARADALVRDAEASVTAAFAELDAQREQRLTLERAAARADAFGELSAGFAALERARALSDEQQLPRLVELARLLAERVLGAELQQSPEQLRRLAEATLAEARGARQLRLRCHPEDQPALATLRGQTEGALTVVADPGLTRGQLRLETEVGSVDANVNGQLERLAEVLHAALAEEQL